MKSCFGEIFCNLGDVTPILFLGVVTPYYWSVRRSGDTLFGLGPVFSPQKRAKIPKKNPAIMTELFFGSFRAHRFPPGFGIFFLKPHLEKTVNYAPSVKYIYPKIGLFSPEIGPYPSETIRNIVFFLCSVPQKWMIYVIRNSILSIDLNIDLKVLRATYCTAI